MKPIIITHRGLQPTRKDHPFEQSLEAFTYQIKKGWGIEFDPNFTKDRTIGKSIIVMHDGKLSRFTDGKDDRSVRDVSFAEMQKMKLLGDFSVPTLHDVLQLIETHEAGVSAMHLKGSFQEGTNDIDLLLAHLDDHPAAVSRMMIFDIKPEHARYMLEKNPNLILAPSVAHSYDIERFNDAVKGTLISVEEAVALGPNGEGLYQWIWADEWDLEDEGGGTKKLYTKEVFDELHDAGYKVALVTPELHGTSTGLLGGEAHPDAKPIEKLLKRVEEILATGPEAICTDYPEEVQEIINASQ